MCALFQFSSLSGRLICPFGIHEKSHAVDRVSDYTRERLRGTTVSLIDAPGLRLVLRLLLVLSHRLLPIFEISGTFLRSIR
ncbi:unnamed protein product [Calypogeia fissa]